MLTVAKEHFATSHDMKIKVSYISLVSYKAKFVYIVCSLLLIFNGYEYIPGGINRTVSCMNNIIFPYLETFKAQVLESSSVNQYKTDRYY